MGCVQGVKRRGQGAYLCVAHEPWDPPLSPGESIAVQGVCLTVKEASRRRFCCELLEETLQRTSLGKKPVGAYVNLERAMRLGDSVGGHFVSGHVDEGGVIRRIRTRMPDTIIEISCSAPCVRELVPKGSIACDGVSLTIVAVRPDSFEVHLIPFTLRQTSFSRAKEGDGVNIETDILGKYVRRFLSTTGQRPPTDPRTVTLEQLHRAGFCDAL